MSAIAKKIVFHFYVYDGWEDCPVYHVHKYFLTKYAHIFDLAEIYIVVDDINNYELIKSAEHFIIDCGFKSVKFSVRKNTWLCESDTLKEEVLDKLTEKDEMCFFCHSKGTMDYTKNQVEKETLLEWITALYYLNLEFEKEVEWSFYCCDSMFYGGLMELYNENIGGRRPIKYRWVYCGGFYWINCNELFLAKDEIPNIGNRFFGEQLPGGMAPPCDFKAYTHNYTMIPAWELDRVGSTPNSISDRIDCVLKDDEKEKFYDCVNEVKEYLKKENINW